MPSLTVHTDTPTGVRIVLAAHRPGRDRAEIIWRRRAGLDLESALAEVMDLAEGGRVAALALSADRWAAEGALIRCLKRAELDGYRLGGEWSGQADPVPPFYAVA